MSLTIDLGFPGDEGREAHWTRCIRLGVRV